MERLLVGKCVIITGASRGLGEHIARGMFLNGANLLLVARSQNALEAIKTDLLRNALPNQEVHIIAQDLGAPRASEKIIDELLKVWQRLDVLVNNAGILGPIGPVWEVDWGQWQDTMFVNLLAPVSLCRAAIPVMRKGGRGKIINLSGGGATGSRPFFSAYAAAKTALVRFSEILAEEARELNIQVNSVAPGALNTDMLKAVLEAGEYRAGAKEYSLAQKQVLTGGADPKTAAELCVFLASDASDGITGKLISAVWDPWRALREHVPHLKDSDIYTLRRIVPEDRGMSWEQK